ncbi:MAG: glycoside hydrolase family 13 protein [Eubacterium sp.]|nr:glycoside hydrolase family 13 protein [Eubacterium sp.]
MNREAIFSSGSSLYVLPKNPKKNQRVTIRCRVGRNNVDKVFLVDKDGSHEMKLEFSRKMFDYYSIHMTMGGERYTYQFQIVKNNQSVYFNKRGDMDGYDSRFDYDIIPGFEVPEWAEGAVMYQIFVDRFYNGDSSTDVVDREYSYIGEHVVRVKDWNKYPATMDVREFYGGDLKGVMEKLDYLQDLGVEVLYLNPIFVSPSNHKYDTQDYDYIDPHYTVIKNDGGQPLEEWDRDNTHATKYIQRVVNKENLEASNEFFAKFMEEVHRRGMKVILDGVFNHCGSFNKWLDREKIYQKEGTYKKGAYTDEDSPYNSFFQFYPDGKWPDNGSYDGWWGHDTLPKLNYENSEKLEKYILKIAKKWLEPPYNVDGWRLDVAADLGHSEEYNHEFWRKFRKTVKSAKKDALILAEHYGDASAWLDGEQWDSVMNYDAFMEPISWFLTGIDKHSDVSRQDLRGNGNEFFSRITENMSRFNINSLLVAMNELSNHDHSRFLTRTNGRVGRTMSAGPEAANVGINVNVMMAAVVMQMTWLGAPTVYYGDEAGLCGWTDPDNRRGYPWHYENQELIRCHKELIRIHTSYAALKTGALIYLINEGNLIGYGRFDDKDRFCILVQSGGGDRTVKVPVWRLEVSDDEYMVQMARTGTEGFTNRAEIYDVRDGYIEVQRWHRYDRKDQTSSCHQTRSQLPRRRHFCCQKDRHSP